MNRTILNSCKKFGKKIALIENGRKTCSFETLAQKSLITKTKLKQLGFQKGDRVCVFGEKTNEFVAIQLGIWRLGGIIVTLLPSYPAKELEHYVSDSQAKFLIATDVNKAQSIILGKETQCQVFSPKNFLLDSSSITSMTEAGEFMDEDVNDDDPACLIYTSGSTAAPKGVVTTHGALQAMVQGMIEKWEWTEKDSILHFLPLHHVHGAINKLLTPLACGAQVEFIEFEPETILKRLSNPMETPPPTIFMGVPTVYAKLVEKWEKQGKPDLQRNLSKIRLFVSGSAALPVHLFDKFEKLSGHRILERWGMTEVGMGLSNPLRPEKDRLPGYVGKPMPGIEVKLVDLDADPDGGIEIAANQPGDLIIRGDSVFKTYWGKAAPLTASEFTSTGWFKTGDVAVYDTEVDSYKIVGRKSVDIIKSGGFKISSLEIERVLLECHEIEECSVLGLPDNVWGETIVAVVVPKKGAKITEEFVKEYLGSQLVKYKVPKRVLIRNDIPKNVMGKVNKKTLRGIFMEEKK